MGLRFTLWFRPKSAAEAAPRICSVLWRCPRCHRRAPGSSCASIPAAPGLGRGGKDWTFCSYIPSFPAALGVGGLAQLGAARRCGTSRECPARPPALPAGPCAAAATSQQDVATGPGSSGLLRASPGSSELLRALQHLPGLVAGLEIKGADRVCCGTAGGTHPCQRLWWHWVPSHGTNPIATSLLDPPGVQDALWGGFAPLGVCRDGCEMCDVPFLRFL